MSVLPLASNVSYSSYLNFFREVFSPFKATIDNGPITFLTTKRSAISDGLIIADEYLQIEAADTIEIYNGGCIAAPTVTLVARRAIELGIISKESPFPKCVIYAPETLSIMAPTVKIQADIYVETIAPTIYCSRLEIYTKDIEEEWDDIMCISTWLANPFTKMIVYRQ